MCFSMKASFVAAGALSIVSLLSIRQVRNRKMLPFALTPLFFGIQQACEGFVWLTLNNNDSTSLMHLIGMYGFLFFAGVFWPMWTPFSLYIAEMSYKRKNILFHFICTGIIVSLLYLFSWILKTNGAIIINHHIDYPVENYPFDITEPLYAQLVSYFLSFLYGIVIIIPFFISSIPYTKLLGITIALAALISYIFYLMAFPSVWCFFAAICSVIIYLSIRSYRIR